MVFGATNVAPRVAQVQQTELQLQLHPHRQLFMDGRLYRRKSVPPTGLSFHQRCTSTPIDPNHFKHWAVAIHDDAGEEETQVPDDC